MHGDEIIPHHLVPHILDFAHLGEKPMPANVEAIAFVRFGSRDATNHVRGFEHPGNMCVAQFLKFIGCCQPCWTTTNDDNGNNIFFQMTNTHTKTLT